MVDAEEDDRLATAKKALDRYAYSVTVSIKQFFIVASSTFRLSLFLSHISPCLFSNHRRSLVPIICLFYAATR